MRVAVCISRRPGLACDFRACARHAHIGDGDVMVVSGPVGDHGTAVMLAREEFGLRGDLISDAGPVMALTEPLLALTGCVSCATRRAAALPSIAHEIAEPPALACRCRGDDPGTRSGAVGLRDAGLRPLLPGLRGPGGRRCRSRSGGRGTGSVARAAVGRTRPIGRVSAQGARVLLQTALGGERFLEELEDDPLPRIC